MDSTALQIRSMRGVESVPTSLVTTDMTKHTKCPSAKVENGRIAMVSYPERNICRTAGWMREKCGHNNSRWIKLNCDRWDCDDCSKRRFLGEKDRIKKAHQEAIRNGDSLKFITLTFEKDVTPKEANRRLAHRVQTIRRKWGKFEYVAVKEVTTKKRIHFHLVALSAYIPQEWLENKWGARVDIRPARCKKCYRRAEEYKKSGRKAPLCTHHRGLVHEVSEELLKYMTKSVVGKLSHSRGWPKADEYKSPNGLCGDCGVEHSWKYSATIEEKLVDYAKVHKIGMAVEDWGEEPMFISGTPCRCWEKEKDGSSGGEPSADV